MKQNKDMKAEKKSIEEIRRWEAELVYANPKRAAWLAKKIVCAKCHLFE